MPLAPPVYGYTATNAFGNLTFANPVAIVNPPGETNRLFIVEQAGRIAVITNLANPNRTVFLDISSQVPNGTPPDERGLLGLAFHPGYATNGFFYVFYAGGASGLYDILSRYQVSEANSNQANAASEVRLIAQPDDDANHNGGCLQFGPDGYLYISLGDEGDQNDTGNNSQRVDKDFFSGILRIDVDKRPGSLPPNPHSAGSTNYAIPPDNPFVGVISFNGASVNPGEVRTEFWAVGLRNPWRFSFDPATGFLYCGEVGGSLREEIEIIRKGGNYGWAYREGALNGAKSALAPAGFVSSNAIAEYDHGNGTNQGFAVIGGVVYYGDRIPQLNGAYVFADNASGNVWMLRYDGTNATPFQRLFGEIGIAAFGVDPRNADVLMANQSLSTIRRLVYSTNQIAGGTLPQTLAATGAFTNLTTLKPHAGILPYEINVPFWSDNALKSRWFSLPNTNLTIGFNEAGNWSFPTGTVWIKHFELELTNGVAASNKRLETRFLVRSADGVYGVTYRWGDSPTNATLVADEGMDEPFVINDGGGVLRTQLWHYPSRSECQRCHTAVGGYALGFNSPQMNRACDYGGVVTNQILALSQAGYYTTNVTDVSSLIALAPATDFGNSLEHRSRSYLFANCAQCHQPGGGGLGAWDARISTPIASAGIINVSLTDNLGDPNNRVFAPGSPNNSAIYLRVANFGPKHMPPLATSVLNAEAIALLGQWIAAFSTAPVLPAQTDRTIPELTTLTVTNTASDADGNNLSYWLLQGPANATIDPHGIITWSPAEADGPSTNVFTTVVMDDGAYNLRATNSFTVKVTERNEAPVLTLPANSNIDGFVAFNAVATATDVDFPTNALTFALVNGPSNLTVSAKGVINWTPSEAQGPGVHTVNVSVTDTNPLAANATSLSVTGSFQLVVRGLLTVTAENASRLFGQTNPVFTGTIIGVQDGDNITASYGCSATRNSPAGAYDIVPTLIDPDGKLVNYAVTASNGILTIVDLPRLLNIAEVPPGTFVLQWRVYPGRTYRVQYKSNLSDLEWTTLGGNQTAQTSSQAITNIAGTNRHGFYRVLDLTGP